MAKPCKTTTPVVPGSHILLAGGKGAKRKFNQQPAFVVSVPTRGSWITVQLESNNTHLKWRKGGCCRRPLEKDDPFQVLDRSVCQHILSYMLEEKKTEVVGDDQPITTSLQWILSCAGKVHGVLRSVSRRWKEVADACLPICLGLVDAHFDSLSEAAETTRFLARHHIKLGSLSLMETLSRYQQLKEFIQGCNLEHLHKLRLYYNPTHTVSMRSMVRPLHDTRIDLTVPDPVVSGPPHYILATSQKELHDLIAEKCVNLVNLAVKVSLPPNPSTYYKYISTALFSKSSIVKMKISFGVTFPNSWHPLTRVRVDGLIFTRLIKNMPGLRQLELASVKAQWLYNRRFHVESENLEILDVTGTGKGVCVSCQCPNLVQYKCNGEPYGNGTRPTLSKEQDKAFSDNRNYSEDVILSVRDYEFPQLHQVADSCLVTLGNFYGNLFVYDELMSARFETFTDV